jgi:recombination protein RecT
MANEIKQFFNRDSVKAKFQELLGKKSAGFITSIMQVVNGNNLLQKASPESIYECAAMGASLDLPINNSLGFAWIVPYGGKAQFQIGWKGFVQLANRTGQYKRINVIEVYESQFKSFNKLTEDLDADFSQPDSGKVVGYVAYFQLINGFEKLSYWSKEQVEAHAKRFSKTYSHTNSVWKSDFDAMAKKTVLKNTISKWGILSIEMQQAIAADQAIINDHETMDVDYVDEGNEVKSIDLPEFNEMHFEQAFNNGATIELIKTGYTLTTEMEQKYNEYVASKVS